MKWLRQDIALREATKWAVGQRNSKAKLYQLGLRMMYDASAHFHSVRAAGYPDSFYEQPK